MNINLTLIGQAISFAIFVWFCMKYVWPPLIKVLEERAATIAEGLAAAEKGKSELDAAGLEVEKLLSGGKNQAQQFILQAQKRAEEIIEAAKSDARTEAEKIKVSAHAEVVQERNQVREELRAELAKLVIAGAEKILMKEIDETQHREMLSKLSARL